MFESLGNILGAVYNFLLFAESGWLVVRLAPICLVLESVLTYVYFKRIKKYESDEKRRIAIKVYWKIIKYKLIVIVITFWLVVDRDGNVNDIRGLRVFKYYYLYTLGVVVAFIVYLVKKYLFTSGSSGRNYGQHERDNISENK